MNRERNIHPIYAESQRELADYHYNQGSKEYMIMLDDKGMSREELEKDHRMSTLRPLDSFIHDLVREESIKLNEYYELSVSNVRQSDLRIILSYLVDIEDYQFYCSSPTRLEIGLNIEKRKIQHLLDEKCNELFFDDLRDSGAKFQEDPQNGELVIKY